MNNRWITKLGVCIAFVLVAMLTTRVARFGLESYADTKPTGTSAAAENSSAEKRQVAAKAEEVLQKEVSSSDIAVEKSGEKSEAENFETLTLRGKVKYLGPALENRYGIETVPEAAERQLVLDVGGGELVPLVEDIRGRAFRADERLRGIEVEILGRRYKNSPFVQVIRLYAVKKEGLFVLDYWCDVCAIAMYELKPCDCCQAPNRLRERKLTLDGIADEEL